MTIWKETLLLIKKDLRTEFRQQHHLVGVLVYCISTIFLLYLSAGQPAATQWNTLFWITQIFIVVNAVIKSFVGEAHGRMIYYYSLCNPLSYLYSKMLFNSIFMALLSLVSVVLFTLLLGNPIQQGWLFFGLSGFGGLSLALLFTMLSAIASKARQSASLVAILGLPIIIPQLVLLIKLSKMAMGEIFQQGVPIQIFGLLAALNFLIIVMASILFPFIWKD